MFASDYPPARLHTAFGEIFEAFRHAVQSFAPAEQAALFHDNAARCSKPPKSWPTARDTYSACRGPRS